MERHAIITGGAGFIGSHLVDRLLDEGGWKVTVIDNFHPFYPRAIKEANIAKHRSNAAFTLMEGDILDEGVLKAAFGRAPGTDTTVIHLAALAGVRPSIADPLAYHQVNVTGTLKLLEQARQSGTAHFVLASSSSVYGEHPGVPWEESITGLSPISPYAATKLAAEQYARVYALLYGLNTTVLRFFTVYGPRQRPDLAIHAFFRKVTEGTPIQQFGDGSTRRDYTFVQDIISGVRGAIDRPLHAEADKGAFGIYNLGNSATVPLSELIADIEQEVGRKAVIEVRPEQPGDVPQTFANVEKAHDHFGYQPTTGIVDGLRLFHRWYDEMEAATAPRQPHGS